MHKSVPLIVFSVFLTFALCLYLGGCAIHKNWIILTVLIPAALGAISGYGFVMADNLDHGWFYQETWAFFIGACGVSCIALPLVFLHCGHVKGVELGMHFGGDAILAIGVGAYIFLSQRDEYDQLF